MTFFNVLTNFLGNRPMPPTHGAFGWEPTTTKEQHLMYEITKDFHFSYSHRLDGLPDDHPCSRLHGHNAVVRLHLASSTLDATGFVIDYRALEKFKFFVDDKFDHQHANDRVDFNPTSENLCRYIYDEARRMGLPVVAVSWSETPKTWATYRPEANR